jgi:hypothetical protein
VRGGQSIDTVIENIEQAGFFLLIAWDSEAERFISDKVF